MSQPNRVNIFAGTRILLLFRSQTYKTTRKIKISWHLLEARLLVWQSSRLISRTETIWANNKKLLLLQPREAMVGSFRQAQPSKALRGENIFLNSIWQRRLSRVFNNTALHAFHITRQNISGEYTGAPTLSFPRTINSEHEFFCHCF